ncbi:MAG TPA: hypothetical protein VFW87_12715 [Pirellulales bacterium]|nr:hypothetical protein [Pirellulales bacterium]
MDVVMSTSISGRFRKQLGLAAFLALICASGSAVRADDPPSIDLSEITRRLAQWRASFVNLRAVWELRTLPKTDGAVVDWPPAPAPETASLFSRIEWIWADHGLDLLERCSFYKHGSSGGHTTEAFNGPSGVVFRAEYRKTSPEAREEFVQLMLLDLGVGKPISVLSRAPFRGLYWSGTAQWLPEILSEWDWKLEAIETIGGAPCARIVAAQPYIEDVEFTEILWLDLNHDFLVRRHSSPAVPRRRASWDFIVDEFHRLDGGVWFPKRGRIQLGGRGAGEAPAPSENQVFVVTEASVNDSIELRRFDPPEPAAGTVVIEQGKPPYKHGASQAPHRVSAVTQQNAAADDVSGAPHAVSAAPPMAGSVLWSVVLGGMSVLFLFTGLWISHRKQEN